MVGLLAMVGNNRTTSHCLGGVNEMYNLFKFKACLLLLIAVVYLIFASGAPWVEAGNQLMVSKNLVYNLSLSTEKSTTGLDVQGKNGRWYDPHGITNILFMLPIAILESAINKTINKIADKNVKDFISFLGALTGVVVNSLASLVFFSILWLWGRSLRICLYTTLCLAFLTIVFPYASNNYEGNLNMLFILSSLYFLFNFLKKNKLFYLVLSGTLTGLAINTREFSLIFLLCMGAFIFWTALKERNIKIFTVFSATMFPFLILWGWYDWLRSGFFYLTPITEGILSGRWSHLTPTHSAVLGLKGLLLSKGGSIFVYSPILIFSVFGWREFFRSRKKECSLVLCIVVLFLLANAKIYEWFGLWSWGPRYTLEITPLLMLPLGYWVTPKALRNKRKKYVFITICVWALLIQLAGTLTNWHGRLGYLLKSYGRNAFLFTFKYSQWWDSIKTLFVNLWNLLFDSFYILENPGHDPTISDASLYTSKTAFTWWNRLIFMEINPIWIGVYLGLSLIIISSSLVCMANFMKRNCKP